MEKATSVKRIAVGRVLCVLRQKIACGCRNGRGGGTAELEPQAFFWVFFVDVIHVADMDDAYGTYAADDD